MEPTTAARDVTLMPAWQLDDFAEQFGFAPNDVDRILVTPVESSNPHHRCFMLAFVFKSANDENEAS